MIKRVSAKMNARAMFLNLSMSVLVPIFFGLTLLPHVVWAQNESADVYDCSIEPNRRVQISTAVEGVLEKVLVGRGDVVKSGQTVALLQSGVEKAAIDLARARATLTAQIDAREARAKFAERKLERVKELVDKKFVSSEEIDDAETEFEVAEKNYQEARESQKLAQLDWVRAKEQYELRVIKSPIDGVVVEAFLSGGEFAQGQPILELVSLHPLHVEVILPVALYGQIQIGQSGVIIPESPIAGEFDAEVAIVDKVVDAASGTFGVRLLLPNEDLTLPAGIECQVQFQ